MPEPQEVVERSAVIGRTLDFLTRKLPKNILLVRAQRLNVLAIVIMILAKSFCELTAIINLKACKTTNVEIFTPNSREYRMFLTKSKTF